MEEESNAGGEQQPQIDTPEDGAQLESPTPPPIDESVLVPETEEITTLTPLTASTPPTATAPPTDPSTSAKEQIEMDLLSEAFDNYMRIANALMKTLKRPKDREICADLLQQVQSLNGSQQLEVKRNNNRFFRFLLRILKYTSENQPLEYYRKLYNEDNEKSRNNSTETRSWLSENKLYMALKTLDDGTFIVYVAVANEPKDGWQDGGLAILDKKAACGRL